MQILIFILGLLIAPSIFAVCPICTFAVGAGIGLAQYFGIDDAISGVWIGGFTVSLIMFTNNWFEKKNLHFYGSKVILTIFYYGTIMVPLFLSGIIGNDLNTLCGFDKLLLGIILGSGAFFLGAISYEKLKKRNNGKAHFPFQKVVMPILPLIILSIVFYVLNKSCL